MRNFFHTVETIPAGLGFSAFSALHFIWLGVMVILCVLASLVYRKMSAPSKAIIRKGIAVALIADELFKQIPLLVFDRWIPDYLPLHLCSINIFLIVWHAWKGGSTIGGFLYTVCIPGALAAMLFPSWSELPGWNFMTIHSFTVHILLILYPVMLIAGADIRPDWRQTPKYMVILLAMATTAYVVNLLLDTNFFFLMEAEAGNPLHWFEANWGNHLLGFPVIIAGVLLVTQTPWAVLDCRKLTQK